MPPSNLMEERMRASERMPNPLPKPPFPRPRKESPIPCSKSRKSRTHFHTLPPCSKLKNLRMVILTLIRALPSCINVIALGIFFFIIYGILGVQLFAGTFYSCNDTSVRHGVVRPGSKTRFVGSFLLLFLSHIFGTVTQPASCFSF
jgi:hypothetical protein